MPFRLPFLEPHSSKYFHRHNRNLVFLMPLVQGGRTIGTDNTCQSLVSLKDCFAREGADNFSKSALYEAKQYRDAITTDISLIEQSVSLQTHEAIKREKKKRLNQINTYIDALEYLYTEQTILHPINATIFGDYPTAVNTLLLEEKERHILNPQHGNLYALQLRPMVPDSFTKFTNPFFRLSDRNYPTNTFYEQVLEPSIIDNPHFKVAWHPIEELKSAVKEKIKNQFGLPSDQAAFSLLDQGNLNAFREAFKTETQGRLSITFDYGHNYIGEEKHEELNVDYFRGTMYYDGNESLNECITAFFDLTKDGLFAEMNKSSDGTDPFLLLSFNDENARDKVSLFIQFFLGEASFHSGVVFKLDNLDQEVNDHLNQIIMRMSTSTDSIYDQFFELIEAVVGEPQFREKFSEEVKSKIVTSFKEKARIIFRNSTPHYDEFLCLEPTIPGIGFNYRNSISILFLDFLKKASPDMYQTFIAQPDFESLDVDRTRASFDDRVIIGSDAVEAFSLDIESLKNTLERFASEQKIGFIYQLLFSKQTMEQESRYIFENLELSATIVRLPNWLDIRTQLLPKIVDNQIKRRFEERFPTDGLLRIILSQEMINALSCRYIRLHGNTSIVKDPVCDRFTLIKDLPEKEKIEKIVKGLYFGENFCTVSSLDNGRYVVTFSEENNQYFHALQESILRYQKAVYISPEHAQSIYLAVKAQFGEESPQYKTMLLLDNKETPPKKLFYALMLLTVPVSKIKIEFPLDGTGVDGYIFINISPEMIETLNGIHGTYRPPESESPETIESERFSRNQAQLQAQPDVFLGRFRHQQPEPSMPAQPQTRHRVSLVEPPHTRGRMPVEEAEPSDTQSVEMAQTERQISPEQLQAIVEYDRLYEQRKAHEEAMLRPDRQPEESQQEPQREAEQLAAEQRQQQREAQQREAHQQQQQQQQQREVRRRNEEKSHRLSQAKLILSGAAVLLLGGVAVVLSALFLNFIVTAVITALVVTALTAIRFGLIRAQNLIGAESRSAEDKGCLITNDINQGASSTPGIFHWLIGRAPSAHDPAAVRRPSSDRTNSPRF